MKNKKENALEQAKDWSDHNPAMAPIKVQNGYTVKYLYQQSVVQSKNTLKTLPMGLTYVPEDEWGIISVESDHELSREEIEEYERALEHIGIKSVTSIRLTKQTFFLKQKGNRL